MTTPRLWSNAWRLITSRRAHWWSTTSLKVSEGELEIALSDKRLFSIAGLHHYIDAAKSSTDVFSKIDSIFTKARSKDKVLFV